MSVADRQLRFTSRGQRDIRNALLDTRRQWGTEHRTIYRRKLNNAFSLIRRNPEIGLARGDVDPAIRSRLVKRHVIYYEILSDAILILRLMHVRMDLPLGPDDLDRE